MEVIGSFSVWSGAGVEETGTAATGLAAGLAWANLELALELGLEGGGLAVGVAELAGGGLAGGWAVVVVVVGSGVLAMDLAAMVREEAGTEAVAIEGFWAGGRSGACCSGNLGVAVVTAGWHGTAVVCGCRGGISIHWGYSIGSSNLSWGLCEFVVRLDERTRLSDLGSKRALCVHWCR